MNGNAKALTELQAITAEAPISFASDFGTSAANCAGNLSCWI
jgi:hypothetical protein